MALKAAILSIEYCLPDEVLENRDLASLFPQWTEARILAKTGISSRHIASPSQCASDLAVNAAAKLFWSCQITAEMFDYVIFCTQTPDYILPTTACLLQHRLGIPTRSGAIDVNLGCSGFVYCLGLAKALVETNQAKNVLLLTGDTYSKLIHPRDKSVRTLFGDAASATWVGQVESNSENIGPFVYGTDGSGAKHLIVPTGGFRTPTEEHPETRYDSSGNERANNNIYMNGPEVFQFAVDVVPAMLDQLMSSADINRTNLRFVVPHQANGFMLEHLRLKMDIPTDRFLVAMSHCGNTVSSSIPIALRCAAGSNLLKGGDALALLGFGVGLSWGGCIIRWHSKELQRGSA